MQSTDNWDLLYTHTTLATMRGDGFGLMENAALAVKEGKIAWVGPMADLHGTAKETHDCSGKLITPGLIDCHTHLVYAGNRSAEMAMKWAGRPYAEIAKAGGGIVSSMKAVRAASEEELFAQSSRRLEALMSEGVTTLEIKSGYGLDLPSERKMLRVARKLGEHYPVTLRTTFLGAHALPPEFSDKDAYITHVCEEMLPALADEGLVDAVDGFCESIAFSPAQIERVFQTAQKLSLPVKLHAEQLTDQSGAALAAKYGALSADHLEYANEEGIRAMAKAGTIAVLLPGAFYMLRETCKPPVELLRQHGVTIAVATDCNPGTSPVTSLLTVMNMSCVLFGLTPEEALRGVTVNAAVALGLEDRGALKAGKRADLVLWEAQHPLELIGRIGYEPPLQIIQNGITQ